MATELVPISFPDPEWVHKLRGIAEKLSYLPPSLTGMDQHHSEVCGDVATFLERLLEAFKHEPSDE